MSDITKCSSKKCPNKKQCFRIKAKTGECQSYCDFSNICNEKNGYKYQLDISKGGRK